MQMHDRNGSNCFKNPYSGDDLESKHLGTKSELEFKAVVSYFLFFF